MPKPPAITKIQYIGKGGANRDYILILDDEPDARYLRELILSELNIQSQSARNSHEALELIAERAPAPIRLDLMMPAMDDFFVPNRLHANPNTRQIPIIVISAYEHASESLKFPGATAVIQKGDYVPRHIHDLVSQALNLPIRRESNTMTTATQTALTTYTYTEHERLAAQRCRWWIIYLHREKRRLKAIADAVQADVAARATAEAPSPEHTYPDQTALPYVDETEDVEADAVTALAALEQMEQAAQAAGDDTQPSAPPYSDEADVEAAPLHAGEETDAETAALVAATIGDPKTRPAEQQPQNQPAPAPISPDEDEEKLFHRSGTVLGGLSRLLGATANTSDGDDPY